jgi:hypothetical protein
MDTKTHIKSAFQYLVSHVGICTVLEFEENEWADISYEVCINGRLFKQTVATNAAYFVFECRTDYGVVTVTFPR